LRPSSLSKSVSRALNVLGKADPALRTAGYKLVTVSGSVSDGGAVTTGCWRSGLVMVTVSVTAGAWSWAVRSDSLDVSRGHSDSYRTGWPRFVSAIRSEVAA
jgi:hypothetical protein